MRLLYRFGRLYYTFTRRRYRLRTLYATKITPCHSVEGRELVERARVELAYGHDPRVAFVTGDTHTAPRVWYTVRRSVTVTPFHRRALKASGLPTVTR